jgi:hypothetical protein
MENLEKEQKPWEKDMQHLAGAIESITEAVRMMMTTNSAPSKPASTSPAPTPQPEKNPAKDIAAMINAGTNKEREKMGKETIQFRTEDDPAPVDEADKEAETKCLASLINSETKQIVADQREKMIRDLTAQLTETQRMLSLKK